MECGWDGVWCLASGACCVVAGSWLWGGGVGRGFGREVAVLCVLLWAYRRWRVPSPPMRLEF
jgi:hypothetical protein